jgi:hypothetical protein
VTGAVRSAAGVTCTAVPPSTTSTRATVGSGGVGMVTIGTSQRGILSLSSTGTMTGRPGRVPAWSSTSSVGASSTPQDTFSWATTSCSVTSSLRSLLRASSQLSTSRGSSSVKSRLRPVDVSFSTTRLRFTRNAMGPPGRALAMSALRRSRPSQAWAYRGVSIQAPNAQPSSHTGATALPLPSPTTSRTSPDSSETASTASSVPTSTSSRAGPGSCSTGRSPRSPSSMGARPGTTMRPAAGSSSTTWSPTAVMPGSLSIGWIDSVAVSASSAATCTSLDRGA